MTTLAELIAAQADALAQFGDDYEAIAAALNAPTVVANPDAGKKVTETVYPTVTLPQVLAAVPSAERVKIRQDLPGFSDDVKGAIDSGNRAYMTTLIEDALTATAISVQTATALALMLAPTTTETTQPATIAGPSLAAAAGLGIVSSAQVQSALN